MYIGVFSYLKVLPENVEKDLKVGQPEKRFNLIQSFNLLVNIYKKSKPNYIHL